MNIGIFMEDFWAGGLDTFVCDLINNWPSPKDSITLFCNYDHPGIHVIKKRIKSDCQIVEYKIPTYSSIRMRRLRERGHPVLADMIKIFGVGGRYILMLLQVALLGSLFKRYNIERILVSTGGYPGSYTCRAAAINGLFMSIHHKPIMIVHNYPSKKAPIALRMLENIIDTLVMASLQKMIFVSQATMKKCILFRPLLKRHGKLDVIHNGIEVINNCNGSNIREELGLNDKDTLLIIAGTFEPRKGHFWLFRALSLVVKKIPSVKLLICGTGDTDEMKAVKGYVSKWSLGKDVFFLGFRNDVVDLMRQVDMALLPSIESESFGLVTLEAWSQKVPVVAGKVGGITEVIDHEINGLLVEPNNVPGLSKAIISLLENPAMRREMGRKGYEKLLGQFTAQRMAQNYYELIAPSE